MNHLPAVAVAGILALQAAVLPTNWRSAPRLGSNKAKPIPISTSCDPKPRRVVDVFTAAAADAALRSPSNDVVLVHGVDVSRLQPAFEEVVPVVAGRAANGRRGLASRELAAILRGEIRFWSQVGGGPDRLLVVMHGGELQRQSFARLAEQLQVSSEQVSAIEPVYGSTYEQVAELGRSYRGSLVIGSQMLDSSASLQVLPIDGRSVADPEYPLRLKIFVIYRNTVRGRTLLGEVERQITRPKMPRYAPPALH